MTSMDRETYENLMDNAEKGGSSWDGLGYIEHGHRRVFEHDTERNCRVYDLDTAKAAEAELAEWRDPESLRRRRLRDEGYVLGYKTAIEHHRATLQGAKAMEAALRKAVATEESALWNRCFDCDTPGACSGEKLCIAGERGHKWIGDARAALARLDKGGE